MAKLHQEKCRLLRASKPLTDPTPVGKHFAPSLFQRRLYIFCGVLCILPVRVFRIWLLESRAGFLGDHQSFIASTPRAGSVTGTLLRFMDMFYRQFTIARKVSGYTH
jgi:hypothetical protein